MEEIADGQNKVAGIRQVIRGIREGRIRCVLAASDADDHIKKELAKLCGSAGVELKYVLTKKELGKAMGLKVDCAAAGIIKEIKG
jgi:large subunit ribosomal protein L7A